MNRTQVNALSNSALALMGDAVHTAFVRKKLIENHDIAASELYKREVEFVSAKAQAETLDALQEELTEEEIAIVRRGKSGRTNNKPKNAQWSDYRKATALETLLGWLYLSEKEQRLTELLERIMTIREEKVL